MRTRELQEQTAHLKHAHRKMAIGRVKAFPITQHASAM